MRSVDVVFPASMCAIIPMLRVSSSLNTRPMVLGLAFFSPGRITAISATKTSNPYQRPFTNALLPAIVRERLVSFRHAVDVFLLLDRSATRVGRVNQFIGELVHHGLASAFPRILQNPANRQGLTAKWIHFDRNLIVRAAHTAGFYFQQGLGVFDRLFEKLQGVVVGFLGHLIHRAVKHALRRALLAVPHHRTDKLFHQVIGIDRVDFLLAAADESFTWHCSFAPKLSNFADFFCRSYASLFSNFDFPNSGFRYYAAPAFGRLAPYFERACLRFST